MTRVLRPWPRHSRYQAADDGTIIGSFGKPIRLFVSPRGYLRFNAWIGGKVTQHFAHVAICEAWHGPRPDGMEVAHLNGKRLDVRPANLAWKTHVENEAHKVVHDTRAWGERHGMRRLTEAEVLAIRASGESSSAIARRYGICPGHVRGIRRRDTWRHI